MTRQIIAIDDPVSGSVAEHVAPTETARLLARGSKSANTLLTYQSQWRAWLDWCQRAGKTPVPADPVLVANYLAERYDRGARASSIRVTLAAIAFGHQAQGHSLATDAMPIQQVLAGIARSDARQPEQAQPLPPELVAEILAEPAAGLIATRDRALVALLYLFGMRASELVCLDWQRIGPGGTGVLSDDGSALHLHRIRGKTIKSGLGRRAAISAANAPRGVEAVRVWLRAANIMPGAPVAVRVRKGDHVVPTARLHAHTITAILQAAVRRAYERQGIADAAALARAFSSHSGRRGLITAARERGVPIEDIADHVGHSDVNTTRRYGSDADARKADPTKVRGVGV